MKGLYYIVPAVLLLSSCVRDGYNQDEVECEVTNYVFVRSFDADDVELTGRGDVSDVELYLFDDSGFFIRSISGVENQQIELPYSDNRVLTVVVWGNSKTGGVVPQLQVGVPIDQAVVSLENQTRNDTSTLVKSPPDYFFGYKKLTPVSQQNQYHTVEIKRIVSSINITARNIPQWLGVDSGQLTFRVNKTPSQVDFKGRFLGNDVSYTSLVAYKSGDKEVSTGVFRTFPSTFLPVSVEIFYNGKLVYTIINDSQGNPIYLSAGRLFNVVIDFGADFGVTVKEAKWGEIIIGQDF